jgi:uncharacterized protein YodC (DUF2158 family)
LITVKHGGPVSIVAAFILSPTESRITVKEVKDGGPDSVAAAYTFADGIKHNF